MYVKINVMCIDPLICVFHSGISLDVFHCTSVREREHRCSMAHLRCRCIELDTHQAPMCGGLISAAPRRRQACVFVPTGNSTEPRLAVGRSGKMCVCAWVHTERILTRIVLCQKESLQLAAGTGHGMRQRRLRVSSDPSVQCQGMQFWISGRNKGF